MTEKDRDIARAWLLVEETARQHSPGWQAPIVEHARIVHDVSLFLAGLVPGKGGVDFKTLELGAILHDVGRGQTERVVEHGVKSGEIIRAQGFSESVARIGETHIGVGITREEAAALGLPERDFVPRTLEERIVCYADNLLFYLPDEKRHELRDTEAVVERFKTELGEDYGRRAREFMEGVERGIGPEGMVRFQAYVAEANRSLAGACTPPREGRR